MSTEQIDWRELCRELVDEWDAAAVHVLGAVSDAIERARTALSQPEPEPVGPTDEALASFTAWFCRNYPGPDTVIYRPEWHAPRVFRAAARAIARWGHPASTDGPAVPAGRKLADTALSMLGTIERTKLFIPEITDTIRKALELGRPAPPADGEVPKAALVRRMCDIILGNTFGNEELDSLALLVGHHRDVLNAPPAPVQVPDCERNWDSILSPSGGYEMAKDAALRDGAQLVNGEWWAPVFGCDSLEPALVRIRERLQRQSAPAPVAVSERLPEPSVKVLAHYFNDLGKGRTICAIWVPAKSRCGDYGYDDFTEYDEETDSFYWPEGWYEAIENWDDLGWVKVDEGEVIYWQPLPRWPAHALPLPGGEVEV